MTEFEVALSLDQGEAIIACRGELDIATADKLQDAVAHVLLQRPNSVHLDLQDVTFFGAQGVVIIVHAKANCEDNNIAFKFTSNRLVDRVLDIVGFDDLVRRANPAD